MENFGVVIDINKTTNDCVSYWKIDENSAVVCEIIQWIKKCKPRQGVPFKF